jgi:hypothetical protein
MKWKWNLHDLLFKLPDHQKANETVAVIELLPVSLIKASHHSHNIHLVF